MALSKRHSVTIDFAGEIALPKIRLGWKTDVRLRA
jgi:hypothetical protein